MFWDPLPGELWRIADRILLVLEIHETTVGRNFVVMENGEMKEIRDTNVKTIMFNDYNSLRRLPILISNCSKGEHDV